MEPNRIVSAYSGPLSIAARGRRRRRGACGLRIFRIAAAGAHAQRRPRLAGPKPAGRQTVLVTAPPASSAAALCQPGPSAGYQVIALGAIPQGDVLAPPITLHQPRSDPGDGKIDAIVNLRAEPIATGCGPSQRRQNLDSRIDMTSEVVRLIARLERKPAVLVSGSAIGCRLWQIRC